MRWNYLSIPKLQRGRTFVLIVYIVMRANSVTQPQPSRFDTSVYVSLFLGIESNVFKKSRYAIYNFIFFRNYYIIIKEDDKMSNAALFFLGSGLFTVWCKPLCKVVAPYVVVNFCDSFNHRYSTIVIACILSHSLNNLHNFACVRWHTLVSLDIHRKMHINNMVRYNNYCTGGNLKTPARLRHVHTLN